VGVLCVRCGSRVLNDAFPAILCSVTNDLTVIWNLAQTFSLLLFGRVRGLLWHKAVYMNARA
jgi:hypothetical protein